MPGQNYIELPTDTGNQGKLVHVYERNVTLSTGATANVQEHFNIWVGINSGNYAEVNARNQGNVTTRASSGLTPNAGGSASINTTSTSVLGVNASRTGFVCNNISSSNISLAFGTAAALNQGITLLPGSSFSMDEYSHYTGAINAIAAAVSSALSYQEYQ
jgi:hypothetical protein